VGISGLFLIMAAAMFGAFELDLPSGLKNRLAQVGGSGYLGAFLLGLACGPIAAPCTGPFLTGILAWIAQTQSAGLGAAAMAAFALGLGVPFFVVGTFAVQLPKSGRWMIAVKSALGIILVVVALYFLNTVFPSLSFGAGPTAVFLGVTGAIALFGLAIGAVHKSFDAGLGDRVRKGFGIVATSAGAFLFIVGASTPAKTLTWETIPVEVAKARALGEERPMIVDFTAAWCGACKELDKLTFAADEVRREAGRFMAVKVDATNDEDPRVEATLSEFGVKGLPTVVVFDSKETEAFRYTDFVEAGPFATALKKVD
jgi:thiol:disulfide interchange protein DsbD